MPVNFDEIAAVAAVLSDSPALTEIEIRGGGGTRLRVRRSSAAASSGGSRGSAGPTPGQRRRAVGPAPSAPDHVAITAELVGTFRTLSGAAALHVGDRVKAGQVVGQIEAIRLLNDCVAPAAGEIVEIAVQDGQPVEYGQLLFELAPLSAED